MNKKSGFGLIEVMAAALVLGFLLVGLNLLQKGNRETIIRVRARDAANIIAQHTLDSLGSIGINSLVADNDGFIIANEPYIYHFKGKGNIMAEITYTVQVQLLDANPGDVRSSMDSTLFTIANRTNPTVVDARERNTFAKGLEATVSWPFKNTMQSIRMAKVVR